MRHIYLDHACTSYPKPHEVTDAVTSYMKEYGMNISRGSYSDSYRTDDIIFDTRVKLADFFGGDDPSHVVFTQSITYALNMTILGFLHPGDHVLVSSLEHNAVMRPLTALSKLGVSFDRIPSDSCGNMLTDNIESMILSSTKAIICMHASNVCGTIQPIAKLGEICHKHHLRFIVDSAQSAGVLPIDMKSMHIDALCFTGHKGLYAPQGIGGMILYGDMSDLISPVICGGTGSFSDSEEMPDILPDKYEPGTQNLPGIFGLHASLGWLESTGIDTIYSHEMALTERLLCGLSDIPQIRIVGRTDISDRLGVVSVCCNDMDLSILSDNLDQRYGLQTRVGLHCAPSAHKTLGTFPTGTLRLSIGFFNTEADIDAAIAAIKKEVS